MVTHVFIYARNTHICLATRRSTALSSRKQAPVASAARSTSRHTASVDSVTTVPSPIYLRSRFRNNSVIISSIMTLLNLRSHLTAPVSDSVLPTCSTSFVSQNAHAPSRPKPLPSSYKSSHVFTGFLSFEIEHDPLLSPKPFSASIPVLLSIYPCSPFTGARPPRLVSLDL